MQTVTTTATFSHTKGQGNLFGAPEIVYQYWKLSTGEVLMLNGTVADTSREITVSYNPLQDMATGTCDLVNAPTLF